MLRQHAGHQRQDVARALTQRGNVQLEGADAEIQIFAELALLHGQAQVFVGGGHNAHVQLDLALAAQAGQLTLLQHAQQFGLQMNRHFANFVQEQGAAVGLFKQATVVFLGTRKGAFFVAKQHVVNQLLGQGRAVQADKGSTGTGG